MRPYCPLVFITLILAACSRLIAPVSPASPTSIPAATATPTLVPGSLPEGWEMYKQETYSIGYAPDWTASPQEDGLVIFNLPDSISLTIGQGECICKLGCGGSSKSVQECLANSADWYIKSDGYQLLQQGKWSDGVNNGDFVEYINGTKSNGNLWHSIRIVVLNPDGSKQTIEAIYTRTGTADFTTAERDQLRIAIASIKAIP